MEKDIPYAFPHSKLLKLLITVIHLFTRNINIIVDVSIVNYMLCKSIESNQYIIYSIVNKTTGPTIINK